MSAGSILAILGGLLALFAPMVLPFITIDEQEAALRSFQVATGFGSMALAALTIGLGAMVLRGRKQPLGWALAVVSLAQMALMALTYANVWNLVPCKSLGHALCDPATGGLLDQTLVTLDWGLVAVVVAAALSLLGGLLVVASHPQFQKEQRFLRVMLVWDGHIVTEKVLFAPRPVTVGEADDNTFQVAARGMTRHTLFTPTRERETYALEVPRGVSGKVTAAGETRDLADIDSLEVHRDDAGLLSFDNGVDIVFQFIGAESGAALAGAAGKDARLAVSFAAVAAVVLVLLTAMMANQKARHRHEAEESLEQKAKELIELTLEDPQPKPEELQPPGEEDKTTGKKAGGEEGLFGAPEKERDKQSKVPKMQGKLTDHVDVNNIGINKALRGAQADPGALGAVLAGDTGTLDAKMVAVAAVGEGSELVIGHGSNGMGFRGTDSGGGDDGWGRIRGPGHIDTGGDTGRNANIGVGRKTTKKVGKLAIASGQSTGGCDKGDIAKNVRARASTLHTCYEIQLMSKPELTGKLTVRWTIEGDGSVSGQTATGDTLGNSAVSDCVLRAISHIRFAKPDAGVCVIQWPFVFSPG